MKVCGAVILVSACASDPAVAQQAEPQPSPSLDRIRASLQRQHVFLTDVTIPLLVAPAADRRRFGVLTFLPPDTPGELVRIRVPIGALVSQAAHSISAARRAHAKQGARQEVARALADFQKTRVPR